MAHIQAHQPLSSGVYLARLEMRLVVLQGLSHPGTPTLSCTDPLRGGNGPVQEAVRAPLHAARRRRAWRDAGGRTAPLSPIQ